MQDTDSINLSTAAEEAYRQQVRNWLETKTPPTWCLGHQDAVSPPFPEQRAWEKTLYEAGYAGITWPKAYGGQGLTMVHQLIASEEMGRLGIPESCNSFAKEMVGVILIALGTEAQKHRFLPEILTMREIWCQGFSEPEAGSDLAGLKTRAVRTDAGWRIDGQKIWTSNAYRADWCFLLARTGSAEDKHRSLTQFLVPMKTPGITVRQIRQMTGRPEYCEVFFDNVQVDADNIVGAVNDGWGAAVKVLEVERATNRMYRASRMAATLRALIRACRSDPNLNALLADSHYRQQLAACHGDIEILRRHVRAAVASLMNAGSLNGAGSVIKLHWSEAQQRLVQLGLDMVSQARTPESAAVLGARRLFEDAYLQARSATIYAGSSEIQLNIIADRVLRLPRT